MTDMTERMDHTRGEPVALPMGSLACMACGVAVNTREAAQAGVGVEVVTAMGRVNNISRRVDNILLFETELTHCAECAAISARAVTLLGMHPRVRAEIGSLSIALDRVEGALLALDVIGQPAPTISTDNELRLLVEHLLPVGSTLRWSRRFSQVLTGDVGTCSSSRWAHVTEGQRQETHDDVDEYQRVRDEKPELFGPPAGGLRGCLLCGVGAVLAMPSRSGEVWTAENVSTGVLGGRLSAERVDGYTCPTCSRAVDEAGSLGATAMERSIVLHLGVQRLSMTVPKLVGLIGWAALGGEPNDESWSHLRSLVELRGALAG